MPKFSNRITQPHFVKSIDRSEDNQFILFTTDVGTYMVPVTTLTEKMYEDEDFPYVLEFFKPTNILAGIIAPDGQTLFRINDSQAYLLSRTPTFTAQMFKDSVPLAPEAVLPLLLEEVDAPFMDRLKALPEDYLNNYYVYETKISYLASNPHKPYLFDPTPSELMHATGLQFMNPSDVPGFFL